MESELVAVRGISVRGIALPHEITGRKLVTYPPGPGWPPFLPANQNQLLAATNAFRATVGSKPLVFLETLAASAEWKSMHMAEYGYLSHEDPPPPISRGPFDRIADNGYTGAAAENIAYGNGLTPEYAVHMFTVEGPGEGHYDNLVNPQWNCCGMGCAEDENGNLFYTQDFGILPASGPRPSISSISPTHGKPGSQVTLLGMNLANATDVVFVQNQRSSFKVGTPSYITATVPANAQTGPLSVSTPGGYALSPEFTVDSGSPTPPEGTTVFEQWKASVWPILRISAQWHNFAGATKNAKDVALINTLLENPKAQGTPHAAFAQAIAADIRLAAAH